MAGRSKLIASTNDFLRTVEKHIQQFWTVEELLSFTPEGRPFPNKGNLLDKLNNRWFRGQSEDWPLLPKAYRRTYDETAILLDARRRAALMPGARAQNDIIGWYFLLQHHGMATRLLDWTESSLVGLYFSIRGYWEYIKADKLAFFHPVVWMLNPNAFNWAFRGGTIIASTGSDEATYDPITGLDFGWGKDNIMSPWQTPTGGPRPPIALTGAYADIRMQVQRGQFTAHGTDREDLQDGFTKMGMLEHGLAVKFRIKPVAAPRILHELSHMGISRSVLFPDFDGLAAEYDELGSQ